MSVIVLPGHSASRQPVCSSMLTARNVKCKQVFINKSVSKSEMLLGGLLWLDRGNALAL